MKNKSINWINVVKALCIVFVFLSHVQYYYQLSLPKLNFLFKPFYVNAFFFVSGYLLFWKQLSEPKIFEDRSSYILMGSGKSLALNILFRIVIPSIIFSIIEFVPSCIIQGKSINVGYALFKTIGGGTYWFTSALVVAELILLLLLCSRRKSVWFYAAICLVLGVCGMVIVKLGILNCSIWMWKQGLLALLFLAMGGLYWRYENQIDKLMRWWFIIPLLLVYVFLAMMTKGYTDPLISTLTIQPLGYVTSAMACLLLVWICKKIPEVKVLSFVGQNSIGFYFMSGALPIIFSMVAHKFVAGSSVWMMLTVWAASIAVAYIAVLIINRRLPWLWDFRKIKKQ